MKSIIYLLIGMIGMIGMIEMTTVVAAEKGGMETTTPKIKIVSAVADDAFLKLMVQHYALENPDQHVKVVSSFSPAEALKQLDAGAADLAVVPFQHGNRQPVFGVLKPFVVVVNPANRLENISLRRLALAFEGKITDWSELGGAKLPIKVIAYNAGSPGADTLCRLLEIKEIGARNRMAEDGERAVAALAAYDANTLACIPVEYVTPDVKILKVDGVAPDRGSIAAGKYPLLARWVVLQSATASPETKKLVALMRGATGADVCRYLSLLPLK